MFAAGHLLLAASILTGHRIIARWSRDSQFWRLAHTDPAFPESANDRSAI
jgi:hypothetical protein